MKNKVVYGAEARKYLKKGVDLVANPVKVTLGAKGLNVMCVRDLLLPIVTKDGVSVAKEVESNNPIISAGVSLIKQVSSQTNDLAGDGTTSSVVLAQAIVNEADKVLNEGTNAISLKRGLDLALDFSLKHLQKLKNKSSSLKTLKNIANISTNGDKEIADLVLGAVNKVGKTGTIRVEETDDLVSSVFVADGYELDVPYALAEFINDREKFEAVFEDMNVLIYQGHLKEASQLNQAIRLSTLPSQQEDKDGEFQGLLVICDNISGHVQKEILEWSYRGFNLMNLRSPSFGGRKNETLKDIAALIGAKVYSEDLGDNLDEVTAEGLGHIDKVISDANKSILIGGKGNEKEIKERTAIVKEQIKNITGGKTETEFVKERYSKLTKGVAVIKVGGYSTPEKREKTDRVEDALCAVRACLEEGYVAGGGVTYLNISHALKSAKIETRNQDEQKGIEVLVKALEAPFRQILENAGMQEETENYIKNIQSSQYYGDGIDLQTQEYVDLFKRGIIDPTKVERLALQNAVSISGTFLTLGAITYNSTPIFSANGQK